METDASPEMQRPPLFAVLAQRRITWHSAKQKYDSKSTNKTRGISLPALVVKSEVMAKSLMAEDHQLLGLAGRSCHPPKKSILNNSSYQAQRFSALRHGSLLTSALRHNGYLAANESKGSQSKCMHILLDPKQRKIAYTLQILNL